MRNKLITKDDIIREQPAASKLRRWWWDLRWKLESYSIIPSMIKRQYWSVIPYNWRPSQIYYRLKCALWNKYNIVRPRYVDSTWIDRDQLLPELMFEVLSDFIEKEGVESIIDWYHKDAPKSVLINGTQINAMDEMLALYNWWHLKYKKAYPALEKEWWDKVDAMHSDEITPIYDEKQKVAALTIKRFTIGKDRDLYLKRTKLIWDMEKRIEEELTEKMCRLSRVHQVMWT